MQDVDPGQSANQSWFAVIYDVTWTAKAVFVDRRIWTSLSEESQRLLKTSLVLLIFMALAGAGTIWHMRRSAVQAATANITELGMTISEQTARSVQATDMVLLGLRERVLANSITTVEAFRQYFSAESVFEELKGKDAELPQASAFTIIDSRGKLVNFSRQWPVPATDLSDRDYFEYFRDHDDPGLFMSHPVRNRGNGQWTAYVVRRVTGPKGQFLGMVLGALDLTYFESFYKRVSADGMSITMLRADGTVLAGYPAVDSIGKRMPVKAPWYGLVAEGRGTYVSSGFLERTSSLVSVHVLTAYPIVVDVGVSYASITAAWREEAIFIGSEAVCAVICFCLLMRTLALQLHRLERSEISLVSQNEALHLARERTQAQTSALAASKRILAEKSEALETTLEHMSQGLLMVTAGCEVAVCNRRAAEILQLPFEMMSRRPLFSEVLEYQWKTEEFVSNSTDMKEFVRKGGILDQPHTYERQRPNGVIVEVCSVPLKGGGVVRTYTDITARKVAEQKLIYVADHDELTGLVNRRVLSAALQDLLKSRESSVEGIAVMYLDLDRFKLVNDTRGHAVGDRLLVEAAQRMEDCLRPGDLVARLGGDEFAVMIPAGSSKEAVCALAERLRTDVSAPYDLDGQSCTIGTSIGIATYPKDGRTSDALLRSADSALYRAKSAGRNTVCYHEVVAEQEHLARRILEQDLRSALTAEEFELAYQPIVNIATGLPSGFEALVRWRHPRFGLLLPDQFIPIAEETGLINDLSRWVIQKACMEAATWAMPVRLAVNLSSVQFSQRDLEQQVLTALDSSGLAADRLDLEVTETVLISDSTAVLDLMISLRKLGVRLVMDDFGTGHSSLKALQNLPFQQIKIDRAFVATMHEEEGGGAIVRAMLTMAAKMKLEVVAEGVETQAQLETLRNLGCQYMQGFQLARPQTPEWTRDYLWHCTTNRGEAVAAFQDVVGFEPVGPADAELA